MSNLGQNENALMTQTLLAEGVGAKHFVTTYRSYERIH